MSDPSPAPGGSNPALPSAGRPDLDVAGHWLLARLGKRVLRPGGAGLTKTLLSRADVAGADVVELAPGLGRTARDILARRPRSYVGVDRDPDAAEAVRRLVAERGTSVVADAASTGLPENSADVVIGEAMLTMQGDRAKNAVVAEAARLLRPGGRYAVHELGLTPDPLPDNIENGVRLALARSIRVNARPQTISGWRDLLEAHGLVVDHVDTAPMALLRPRRILADEGLTGALRFIGNLIAHPNARRRVLAMRRAFRANRQHLIAVAIIGRKPSEPGG
jgi:SAM-dependent methyltransferase